MQVTKAPEYVGKAAVKATVVATKALLGFVKGVGKQTIKSLTNKGENNGK